MALAWIAVALVFAIGEVLTVALFAAFLSLGAVAAAIVGLTGETVLAQGLAFGLVSLAGVVVARPFLIRHLMRRSSYDTVSGASSMIGEVALVVQAANGLHDRGHVRILGENWPAMTRDGSPLVEGSSVRIVDIEGATLVVELLAEEAQLASDMSPTPEPEA